MRFLTPTVFIVSHKTIYNLSEKKKSENPSGFLHNYRSKSKVVTLGPAQGSHTILGKKHVLLCHEFLPLKKINIYLILFVAVATSLAIIKVHEINMTWNFEMKWK